MKKVVTVLISVFGLVACAANNPTAVTPVQSTQPFQERFSPDVELSNENSAVNSVNSQMAMMRCIASTMDFGQLAFEGLPVEQAVDERLSVAMENCQDYVDRFNVYELVGQANRAKSRISEREAWDALQESYRQFGRKAVNEELHKNIRFVIHDAALGIRRVKAEMDKSSNLK